MKIIDKKKQASALLMDLAVGTVFKFVQSRHGYSTYIKGHRDGRPCFTCLKSGEVTDDSTHGDYDWRRYEVIPYEKATCNLEN